jgi:SAM-dependent methyltransferase
MDKIMSLEKFRKIEQKASEIDEIATRNYSEVGCYYDKRENKDFWWYIPFHQTEDLFHAFSVAKKNLEKNVLPYRKNQNIRFLDVGAGTGRIVKIAKDFGFDAFGIEYEEKYIKAGRNAFGFSEKELFQKDAFDIDMDLLKDVDIIYTYMPVKNEELMGKLHCQLYSRAKYQTILLEMHPVYYPTNVLDDSKDNLLRAGNNFSYGLALRKW